MIPSFHNKKLARENSIFRVPKVAPFGWFGGKGRLFPKILPYIDYQYQVYCEPFCGGASIFFHKKKHEVEVLNDLNKDIVNFFRVLQDRELCGQLKHRLENTPYSVEEFSLALKILESNFSKGIDINRAWAFFVRQNQGFSGIAKSVGNWSRSIENNQPCHNYLPKIHSIEEIRNRLLKTQIDCKDGLDFIKYWDSEKTLFYIDPPYVPDTRKSGEYLHELTTEGHKTLVDLLLNIKGKVLLSGYNNKIYTKLEKYKWKKIEFKVFDNTSNVKIKKEKQHKRIEVLWINK